MRHKLLSELVTSVSLSSDANSEIFRSSLEYVVHGASKWVCIQVSHRTGNFPDFAEGNSSISIYQADAQPYALNTSNTYAPNNPATQARYPTGCPTRQAPTNRTYHHINGTGEGHEESHATGSAHPYYQNNNYSLPRPPQILPSSRNYPDQGMYYHQTAPVYARELNLDDETATSTTESGYPTQKPQQTDQYAQQCPSTHGNQQGYQDQYAGDSTHPPTVHRWSQEISPEERLRLGLPRYESEEQRLAYERSASSYEPAQQS
jgi:hypothetical protein